MPKKKIAPSLGAPAINLKIKDKVVKPNPLTKEQEAVIAKLTPEELAAEAEVIAAEGVGKKIVKSKSGTPVTKIKAGKVVKPTQAEAEAAAAQLEQAKEQIAKKEKSVKDEDEKDETETEEQDEKLPEHAQHLGGLSKEKEPIKAYVTALSSEGFIALVEKAKAYVQEHEEPTPEDVVRWASRRIALRLTALEGELSGKQLARLAHAVSMVAMQEMAHESAPSGQLPN
jgi:hypothetical protein